MRYNTLLLDVDGTLVGTKNSPIGHDPRLKYRLDNYIERGGKVGLVTGRSEYYVAALYEFLGLNGVRILEMGAGIIMPDYEKRDLTPLEGISKIKDFLKQNGIFEIMKEEPKSFMLSLMLPDFPNHDPRKLKLIYDSIKEKFEREFPNVCIVVDDHTIDIYNPKSDKGEAIKVYAEREGINLDSIAIVGDSRGDYPGFRIIGKNNGLIGYVGLDNSYAEELKKEFPNVYIAKEKRSSGVVEIINYLLSN